MSAPERIWAWPLDKGARVTTLGGPPDLAVCYVRSDLPPTLSATLAMPEVRALVDAAKTLVDHPGWGTIKYTDDAMWGDGAALLAAIRAIETPK